MYAPYQAPTEWLIVGELIFVGLAALLRNRHRGGDATPQRGIMVVIVGLSDFLGVIFAILVASRATIAFGTFWGLIIIIVTSAMAGIALAMTVASRRGLEISAKDTLTAPRRHLLPSLVGAVAGTIVGGLPGGTIIGVIFGASLSHGQRVRKSKMTVAQLVSPLAATLAVPENDLTDGSCRWEIRHDPNGDVFIFPHPSARMLSKIDGIPARCATYLPDYHLTAANSTEIVLSPLDDETKAQRERSAQLAEQHEGLVVDIRPSESPTPTTDSGEGVDLDLSGEDF